MGGWVGLLTHREAAVLKVEAEKVKIDNLKVDAEWTLVFAGVVASTRETERGQIETRWSVTMVKPLHALIVIIIIIVIVIIVIIVIIIPVAPF